MYAKGAWWACLDYGLTKLWMSGGSQFMFLGQHVDTNNNHNHKIVVLKENSHN